MNETAVVIVLSGFSCVLVGVWCVRFVRRGLLRFKDWLTPRGVTFGICDVPLSTNEWQRFAALAVARGVAQKTLLAECVKFYLAEKVK
jgi:hypothetical protein